MFHSLNLNCPKLCFSAKTTVVSEKQTQMDFPGSGEVFPGYSAGFGIRDLTATREAGVAIVWVQDAGSEKKTIFGRAMTEVWDAGFS